MSTPSMKERLAKRWRDADNSVPRHDDQNEADARWWLNAIADELEKLEGCREDSDFGAGFDAGLESVTYRLRAEANREDER